MIAVYVKTGHFLCEAKFCCFFKLTSVNFFFSLEELDGSLDETSDEYADSGSEVEMKVTRTLEQPAPRVSFAFYPLILISHSFKQDHSLFS